MLLLRRSFLRRRGFLDIECEFSLCFITIDWTSGEMLGFISTGSQGEVYRVNSLTRLAWELRSSKTLTRQSHLQPIDGYLRTWMVMEDVFGKWLETERHSYREEDYDGNSHRLRVMPDESEASTAQMTASERLRMALDCKLLSMEKWDTCPRLVLRMVWRIEHQW